MVNFDLLELMKIPIMREKWIRRYFMVPIKDGVIKNPAEKDEKLQEMQDMLLRLIKQGMLLSDLKDGKRTFLQKLMGTPADEFYFQNTLNKNPTSSIILGSDNKPYSLVRFIDKSMNEKESDKIKYYDVKHNSKIKDSRDGRSYLFSPLDDPEGNILRNIELNLNVLIEINPSKAYTLFEIEKGVVFVKNVHGLHHEEYPLEKRLLLHKANPNLDKHLFGQSFDEFINQIMKKKNDDAHMKEYCSMVEKILKKNKYSIN